MKSDFPKFSRRRFLGALLCSAVMPRLDLAERVVFRTAGTFTMPPRMATLRLINMSAGEVTVRLA